MKTMSIICRNCDSKFEILKKEYNRQIKQKRQFFFCSRSCSTTFLKTTTQKIKRNCLWCKKEFESTTHKKGKMCCSSDCSSKYSQSFVNPKQISKSISELWSLGVYGEKITEPRTYSFICKFCHLPFSKLSKKKLYDVKTCSDECYRKWLSKLARENPNCGGETNYRRYRYKGILMDSRWEVDLAKWMDEKGIVWDRSKKRHQLFWFDELGNNRRYYPDFFVPKIGIYVDPKNPYLMKCDKYKIQQVMKRNKVEVVCGSLDVLKKMLIERCL